MGRLKMPTEFWRTLCITLWGPFRLTGICLHAAEFAMNNAWNSSVKNTPFKLNYGQPPYTPASLEVHSRNSAVNQLVGKWSEQVARAKQCLAAAQDLQKAAADGSRLASPEWSPGQFVLLSIKHFRLQAGCVPSLRLGSLDGTRF